MSTSLWTGPHRNVPVLHACTYRRCAPLCSSREVHQAVTPLPFSGFRSTFLRYQGVGEKQKVNVDGLMSKSNEGGVVEGEERRRVQLDLTLSMA